jgi:hypothetical protein
VNLKEELTKVEAELATAQVELASLVARVHGLMAQRDALAAATAQEELPHAKTKKDLAGLPKDRAIITVLRQSDRPLGPAEITQRLREAGREQEKAGNISVYLTSLLKQGRVTRIRHGRYVAA